MTQQEEFKEKYGNFAGVDVVFDDYGVPSTGGIQNVIGNSMVQAAWWGWKAAKSQAVPDTIGRLSLDAKETLHGMIDYCLENGIAMGMDEGFDYTSDGEKHEFRLEIESLRDTLEAAQANGGE